MPISETVKCVSMKYSIGNNTIYSPPGLKIKANTVETYTSLPYITIPSFKLFNDYF